MKSVITGVSTVCMHELDAVMTVLSEKTRSLRYICDLEKLTIAAVERLLNHAGIIVPVGTDTIGIYIGIDDSIEDVKNEYLQKIIEEGLLGASPLLFPFTSPNAVAAQATIVFDIRGESVVMPCKGSIRHIVEYADERVSEGPMKMAIAGTIFSTGKAKGEAKSDHEARFYLLEDPENAKTRGVRTYEIEADQFV